jgi:eukaryotic-like serine/threonine-protein kinase
MEYVDGKTLEEVIPASGLRQPVALKYAIQMADALARAHEAGIIHRDLKPSNVMVTVEGRVKVLDFGLAKLLDRPEAPSEEATHTRRALTEEGAVLGTPNYMSPEQAEGRTLDPRSDIFSFGSVLYELLTGHRAFDGASPVAAIAKILSDDPRPIAAVVPPIHQDLAKIVARCLRKDPARRFQHMGDVKVALEEVQEESATPSAGTAARVAAPSRARWRSIAGGVAVLLLATGGFVAARWLHLWDTAPPMQVVQLTTLSGTEKYPTLAPDGQQVAFTWSGPTQDNDDVYVQRIGSGQPLRLTTDAAVDVSPAWSPDGNWIAFLRGQVPGRSELRLIAPLGGPERKLTDITIRESYISPPYFAWMPDSRSLVVVDAASPAEPAALVIVSAETGEKRRLSSAPGATHVDMSPAVSPDGRSIVVDRRGELHLISLADDLTVSSTRRLTESDVGAQEPAWLPNGTELVVSAQRHLWRLNVSKPQALIELPFVGENAFMPVLTRGRPGASDRLVYVRGTVDPNIWRVTTERPGAPVSAPTLTLSSTVNDANPQFSPDGSRIAFQSNRSGNREIWVADSSGANQSQLTFMGGDQSGSARWSPDGQAIAFDSLQQGQWDVYVVAASGGKPRPVTSGGADDTTPSFSRDGKWIYFASNRTGEFDVWRFAVGGGEPTRVTRNGGYTAFESVDGSQLYYTQAEVGASSLWQVATTGGEPIKLLDHITERAFTVLERGIYYLEHQPERAAAPFVLGNTGRPEARPVGRLRFYDFRSGRSTVVSEPIDGVALGLTASPDGRTVLYTTIDSPASDLFMVENFR